MEQRKFEGAIEVVRGGLGEDRAGQILRFWSREAGVEEAVGRQHLARTVCVVLDGEGEVAGSSSAYPADVQLIGGRRFWIYRNVLLPDAFDAAPELISATFEALQDSFDPAGDEPIGLCLLIGDREQMASRPEAEWSDPRFIYAGYLADGSQVRTAYFAGAKIGLIPGANQKGSLLPDDAYELGEGYRVSVFAERQDVTEEDVIDLWTSEGVLRPEEAARRVKEVQLIVTDESRAIAGVTTAFVRHNPQLRMDMWHYRAFVAKAHRTSNVGIALALRGRDHLQSRYVSGEDNRGAGIIYEVENEGLKRYFNDAHWLRLDFMFIGENEHGAHVRVHYFPGAPAPEPG